MIIFPKHPQKLLQEGKKKSILPYRQVTKIFRLRKVKNNGQNKN